VGNVGSCRGERRELLADGNFPLARPKKWVSKSTWLEKLEGKACGKV